MTRRTFPYATRGWIILLLLVVGMALAVGPSLWRRLMVAAPTVTEVASTDHDHGEGHAHSHDEHADDSIELSSRALRNIGYQPRTIELGRFSKSIQLPAIVAERPGRSQIAITAPLTGVITRIVPIHGAAVPAGGPLFDIRLTHEELVGEQRDLIRTAVSLDVVEREIARLEALGEGIVAGQRVLEQKYEKQRLEATLQAASQSLVLHGLEQQQVDDILERQQLLKSITVRAPVHEHEDESCQDEHLFHVQELPVKMGQHVDAGQTLAVLADHCELYVEGRAFEDDALGLRRAARNGWEISASLLTGSDEGQTVEGLKLLYLSDHVDAESRSFRFYLSLPNQIELDQASSGHRFIEWRFKPGQRMELRVPIEKWEQKIVLPVEAVVGEGPETYVYRKDGDHFDRVEVHVEFRDQKSVVIASDDSLAVGDVVAAHGAYQMHLAIKNKSGGGVDPHAGHSH